MAKLITKEPLKSYKRKWGHTFFFFNPPRPNEVDHIKTYHKIPEEASLLIIQNSDGSTTYRWSWYETEV